MLDPNNTPSLTTGIRRNGTEEGVIGEDSRRSRRPQLREVLLAEFPPRGKSQLLPKVREARMSVPGTVDS